jgi:hypothetical protein
VLVFLSKIMEDVVDLSSFKYSILVKHFEFFDLVLINNLFTKFFYHYREKCGQRFSNDSFTLAALRLDFYNFLFLEIHSFLAKK